MTRHSKNNTAGAFYSYAERQKDSKNSSFGSLNSRLSKDSVGDFDCCNITLHTSKDPVCTLEGILYDREALLKYMIDQKHKIQETKKRKRKAEETSDTKKKVAKFEGLESENVSMKRFGSSTRSFWQPGQEIEEESAHKEKDVEKVLDPVTGNPLRLKKLITVKLIPIDPTLSDSQRFAKKERWKCPLTGDVLSNRDQCCVIRPTGDVVTRKTVDKCLKDMIWPIGDIKLKEKDIIDLRRGGTGFASANEDLKAKLYRPVMQA